MGSGRTSGIIEMWGLHDDSTSGVRLTSCPGALNFGRIDFSQCVESRIELLSNLVVGDHTVILWRWDPLYLCSGGWSEHFFSAHAFCVSRIAGSWPLLADNSSMTSGNAR